MISERQKKYILEGMCRWAEGEIVILGARIRNRDFHGFKPSLGDRMIFRRILEMHLPTLDKEYEPLDDENERASGNLLGIELIKFSYDYSFLGDQQK